MRWVTLQNGDARRASRRWPQDAILLQVLVDVGSALGLMYQSLSLSAPGSCGAKAVVIVRLARSDSHPSMLPACVDVCLFYFCENWVAGALQLYLPGSPARAAVDQIWDCVFETRPRVQGAKLASRGPGPDQEMGRRSERLWKTFWR